MFIYESLIISIRKFERTFQGFQDILLPNSSRIHFFKNKRILLKKKALFLSIINENIVSFAKKIKGMFNKRLIIFDVQINLRIKLASVVLGGVFFISGLSPRITFTLNTMFIIEKNNCPGQLLRVLLQKYFNK